MATGKTARAGWHREDAVAAAAMVATGALPLATYLRLQDRASARCAEPACALDARLAWADAASGRPLGLSPASPLEGICDVALRMVLERAGDADARSALYCVSRRVRRQVMALAWDGGAAKLPQARDERNTDGRQPSSGEMAQLHHCALRGAEMKTRAARLGARLRSLRLEGGHGLDVVPAAVWCNLDTLALHSGVGGYNSLVGEDAKSRTFADRAHFGCLRRLALRVNLLLQKHTKKVHREMLEFHTTVCGRVAVAFRGSASHAALRVLHLQIPVGAANLLSAIRDFAPALEALRLDTSARPRAGREALRLPPLPRLHTLYLSGERYRLEQTQDAPRLRHVGLGVGATLFGVDELDDGAASGAGEGASSGDAQGGRSLWLRTPSLAECDVRYAARCTLLRLQLPVPASGRDARSAVAALRAAAPVVEELELDLRAPHKEITVLYAAGLALRMPRLRTLSLVVRGDFDPSKQWWAEAAATLGPALVSLACYLPASDWGPQVCLARPTALPARVAWSTAPLARPTPFDVFDF